MMFGTWKEVTYQLKSKMKHSKFKERYSFEIVIGSYNVHSKQNLSKVVYTIFTQDMLKKVTILDSFHLMQF